MKGFIELNVKTLKENVFRNFDNEWTLVTAGNKDSFNTMTASWGSMGILWNRPIAICFVRPQRYTHKFTESSDYFTLSFFEEKYRDILNYCGSVSGKNYDKIKETGLIPVYSLKGNIGFSQARLIFECRKLYADYLKAENFIVKEVISRHYPKSDFHRFYIGEIEACYSKKY